MTTRGAEEREDEQEMAEFFHRAGIRPQRAFAVKICIMASVKNLLAQEE